MKKIAEKKKPKTQEKKSSSSKEDHIKKLLDEYEQLPLEKSATNYGLSYYHPNRCHRVGENKTL